MTKWIRWKGLIAFVLIVGLSAVFFIFYIDSLIKWSIEASGTRIVGAKVELGSAKFSFSPLGVQLRSLQVTNPDKPMENIVEISKIAFNMDSGNLLLRKVIIEEMTVDNVQLNTPRKKSGALKKKAEPAPAKKPDATAGGKKDEGFSLPGVELPNIDDIMAREKLKTPELAEQFKADTRKTKQEWDGISKQLPTQERMDSHKRRYDALRKVNTKDVKQVLAALEEAKSLKNDVNADIKAVKDAKNKVSEDVKRLKGQLKELKSSPKEEYNRLLNKYNLSEGGMGNISQLLFGDQAKQYTAIGLQWYKKLSPYLEKLTEEKEPEVVRQKGLDIRFPEKNPQPSFLIKTIHAGVTIPAGKFKGQILNISTEQDITRKPTTMKFSGDNMQHGMSLLLTGRFDHIKPSNPVDSLVFTMKNYKLDDHKLINSNDMRVTLKDARSDMEITAGRSKDQINANGKIHIHSIQYNNTAGGNTTAKLVLGAINQTRDFNIYGKLDGTLDNYSTKITSDLDERIKGNFKKQVNAEKEKYKQELKKRVDLAVKGSVDKAEKEFEDAKKSVEQDIDARKAKLEEQLASVQQRAQDYQNQSKAATQNKLKDKAKDSLKKLFGR
ncbi:MAG: TIGR03545 family protein [Gammaproteobacteria bacterium]|nr:TIGR03545 family protein [Gammaproteobacteria bacterium]MDH5653863.1 TIGR03545 family protein [Gammaproteobacteria bacterium]